MLHRLGTLCCVAVLCASCGEPPPATLDGGSDAGATCECDDGQFCNGEETCGADGACVDGTPPCTAMQTCSEAADLCESTAECDIDGDGHDSIACEGMDCDDDDADRYPSNIELCDAANVDEDCDPATFGATDSDGDGYVSTVCCNGDACADDCDDADATVHPTANDFCNGVDEDCDSGIDEAGFVAQWVDADGDGYGESSMPMSACPETSGLTDNDDDCDDAEPIANPSTPEVCDSIDNDCDGTADDGATEVSWYVDSDGDGFGSTTAEPVRSCAPVAGHVPRAGDCDDTVRAVNPGAAERCNGRDDDCNGAADFRISTGNLEDDDGDGAPDAMCPGGTGTDCDDTDVEMGPTVPDFCGDAVDNNCNGTIDEATGMSSWYLDADGDGWGDSTSTPITSCMPQAGRSFRGGDCDDDDENLHPGLIDGCDGVDVDCDGERDEDGVRYAYFADVDLDGYGAGAAIFACVALTGTSERSGDCAPTDATQYPGRAEDCNGRDDDCDTTIDEMATLRTFYTDADGDGHGVSGAMTRMACVAPSGFAPTIDDCDDTHPGRYPGAPELCNDIDDDCNGTVDGAAASTACTFPNAVGACEGGFCDIGSCVAPYADCDGLLASGCESSTTTSELHCGGCGMPCAAAAGCVASMCESGVAGVYAGGGPGTNAGAGGCARRPNGRIACWGTVRTGGGSGDLSPVEIVLPDGAVADGPSTVAVGTSHSCAVMDSGRVNCWGSSEFGQYGDGCTTGACAVSPRRAFPTVADATQVVVMTNATCVLRASGRVLCAGEGVYGQLGDGTSTTRSTPVLLSLTGVTTIDAAWCGACAIASGVPYCWGGLGSIGGVMYGSAPTQITGIADATQVTTAFTYGCALRTGGAITCWGAGLMGAALGTYASRVSHSGFTATPVEIEGARDKFCARLSSGFVECWGAYPGDGTTAVRPPTGGPARVTAVTSAIAIAVSEYGNNACSATTTGVVRCWGGGAYGTLGDGSTMESATPTRVTGF